LEGVGTFSLRIADSFITQIELRGVSRCNGDIAVGAVRRLV
jgi:hypothetical protein